MKILQTLKLPKCVKIISPIICNGIKHVKDILEEITSKGGEGIMLNEPNSLYTIGRSELFKKIKVNSFY